MHSSEPIQTMEGRSAQLGGCQQMAKEARPELSEEAPGCLLTEKHTWEMNSEGAEVNPELIRHTNLSGKMLPEFANTCWYLVVSSSFDKPGGSTETICKAILCSLLGTLRSALAPSA